MPVRLTPRLKYPFPDFLTGDEEIVRLYESGLRGEEVAAKVGLKWSTVYYRLRRLGLTRGRGKHRRTESVAPTTEAVRMYKTGLSTRQIAKRLGTNHRTILNRLVKAGVSRRQGRWYSRKPIAPVEVLRLYRDGKTTADIAKQIGYTPTWVGQTIRSLGVRVRRMGLPLAKNPNWHGGVSFLPYGPEFTKELKERIRERDGRACQLCGMTEVQHRKLYPKANGASGGQKNPVHHVNYDKKDCSEGNLITLCHDCNSKVNFGRGRWQAVFQKKLEVLCGN